MYKLLSAQLDNYITEYFDEGEFNVEIDDDLQELVNNERKPIEDFKGVVEDMLSKMVEKEKSRSNSIDCK